LSPRHKASTCRQSRLIEGDNVEGQSLFDTRPDPGPRTNGQKRTITVNRDFAGLDASSGEIMGTIEITGGICRESKTRHLFLGPNLHSVACHDLTRCPINLVVLDESIGDDSNIQWRFRIRRRQGNNSLVRKDVENQPADLARPPGQMILQLSQRAQFFTPVSDQHAVDRELGSETARSIMMRRRSDQCAVKGRHLKSPVAHSREERKTVVVRHYQVPA